MVYPDSAPANWREILDGLHIEWVESPLHDKDINPDGTPKKPHWHIILLFDGKKSFEQIKEITDSLNSPHPQFVQSVRPMVRYLAHLDNPDKAQYSVSEIIAHGGVDLAELLKPTSSNRYALIAEMLDFIEAKNYTEFWDFLLYARQERFDDWFPLLSDNSAFVIKEAIKSRRHRPKGNSISASTEAGKTEIEKIVDEEIF